MKMEHESRSSSVSKASLKRIIRDVLLKHLPVYAVLRCIQNAKNERMQKLVLSFKDTGVFTDTAVLLVEHGKGNCFEDKIIFDIGFGTDTQLTGGFFAMMRVQLEYLDFADHFGFTPVIRWGKGVPYYDSEMDSKTTNAYEYFFEPVSEIAQQDVEKCRNIIHADVRQQNRGFFLKYATGMDSYKLDEHQISVLAGIYKKHIVLNNETKRYLAQQIKSILCEKRTLGVHVRGTDFNKGLMNHPFVIRPGEYQKKAKEMFEIGDYEKVFLATDDLSALQLFKDAFGDKLVYYTDTLRSDQNEGVHLIEMQRTLHHYKLGLEVLRDAYTLACCDGLLAGLSQVSFAARYINLSLDRSYKDIIILNKGVKSCLPSKNRGGVNS